MSEDKQGNDAPDNDEFKVNVRRETSSVERSDEEIFDEVVAENDEPATEESVVVEETKDEKPEMMIEPREDTSQVQSEEPALVEKAEPVVTESPVVDEQPTTAPVVVDQPKNNPGVLVLQWVSYAFWGWFGASLLWLAGTVVNHYVAGTTTSGAGEEIAYPLASVVVMLLCAAIADYFYAKHEPQHKTGGSMVIMLIHAVLFIMVAVGSLIAAVFALITIFINNDPLTGEDGTKVALAVAAVGVAMFGALTLRVLMAGRRAHVRRVFWLFAGALAIGFVVACVAGPVGEANATKDDRLIESALPDLASDINTYVSKNDKLPEKLSDVPATKTYDPSSKQRVQAMIDKGLVRYKANTKPDPIGGDGEVKPMLYQIGRSNAYYYQLCVTYSREKGNLGNYEEAKSADAAVSGASVYQSSTYVNTSSHPKGEKCYNLTATGKYNDTDYGYSGDDGAPEKVVPQSSSTQKQD